MSAPPRGYRPVQITAALLLAGALGVHQLRYLLAFGGDAGSALSHHGHGWLMVAMPLLAGASAVGFAVGLARAAVAPASGSAAAVRLRRVWPAASAALLGIYASQELLEGLLAPGHPAGIDAVFGAGGWVAIPAALALGAIVALGVRVARAVASAVPARIRALRPPPPSPAPTAPMPTDVPRRPGRLLAEHRAGRAPPALSV